MGYRTSERLPLIESEPSNKGIYQDLFSLAAKKVGCTLHIKRAPKKRILTWLKQGKIDFYPGLGFNLTRQKYLYFAENGLQAHTVILTHNDIDSITSFTDLKGKILLKPYGSRDFDLANQGIMIRHGQDIDLNGAITLLEKRQVDLFIHNKDSLLFYLANHPNTAVKIHDCCFNKKPMHLGFSKASKHFASSRNQRFDSSQPISPSNLSLTVEKYTLAYQFLEAVKKVAQSKTFKQQQNRYYRYSAALESEQLASSDISETKH